ncbi:MAG: alpha/beta hydrolase [Natronomonas sp.]
MSACERTELTAPDGTRICCWGRVPTDATEAVIFVHGATYGGRSAFDPDGVSWLDAVAATGRAAYAPDIRGYGDSERPDELDMPADRNAPVVRASTAARDAATVVAEVDDSYETVHLVGYSWGTMISGVMLTELNVEIESLVQYAPVYHPAEERRDRFGLEEDPKAFRRVTKAEAGERWAAQRQENTAPQDAFAAFWDVLVSSGQRIDDDEIIAPNGTLVDLDAALETPVYDAAAIDVPTLVVRGSLDIASTRTDALTLYDAVGGANRTYTEIAGGTHFLQFESNRDRLYETVESFHDRIERDRC